jgi:Na+-driven multidrug efflux pump
MALAMPFLGIQMILRTLFQSIGYSIAALVLTLGRQGIFLIPSLLIMSHLWGLTGYMAAMPSADILTTLLAVVLVIFVRKKLKSIRAEESETSDDHTELPCKTP